MGFTTSRTGKFNSRKTNYNGVLYDSKLEADFAIGLDIELKQRKIKSWRRQVRIPLKVNDILICTYVCDFEITHKNGTVELVEVKGFQTAVYKLKLKLLKATFLRDNNGIKYTIVG